jgi:hypothetical protein
MAWGFALAVAIIGTWVVLFVRRGDWDVAGVLWSPALAVGFTSVGAVIAARRPGHPIGRLCLAIGLVLGVQLALTAVIAIADVRPGRMPAWMFVAANVTDSLVWLGVVGIAALFTRYPDGRLMSPRWRSVDALMIGSIGFQAVLLVRPGEIPVEWILRAANPIAALWVPGGVFEIAETAAYLMLALGLALSVVALAVRYARSASTIRAQIRWILSAVVAAVGGAGLILVSGDNGPVSAVAFGLLVLSPILIPMGIGVAILRYRLYEIDRIVSRTIGYAAVTGVLGLVFLGANLVLQTALAPLVRADTIVVAASTLLVAALFSPVRARTQRAVDRRFHRARIDAERLAAAFAERLRDEVDLEALRARSMATAADAVEPDRIALWLRAGRPSS